MTSRYAQTHATTLLLALSIAATPLLAGCEQICEAGIEVGNCPAPCTAVSPSPRWQDPSLAELLDVEGAVLCEVSEEREGARAKASLWVPGKVHDANMKAVNIAQSKDWSRVRDNWYDSRDTSDRNKESLFVSWRGGILQYNVGKKDRYGARWDIEYDGYPPMPVIPEDATFFSIRMPANDGGNDAYLLIATFDGKTIPLWTVKQGDARSGPSASTSDTLFFGGSGSRDVKIYGPDRTFKTYTIPETAMPAKGGGSISAEGLDHKERYTLVFSSNSDRENVQLGRVDKEGNWDVEEIPIKTTSSLPDLTYTKDGATFAVLKKQVIGKTDGGEWLTGELKHNASLDQVVGVDGGRALIATERGIARATIADDALEIEMISKIKRAKLYPTNTDLVIARNESTTLLIRGDEVESIDFFNGSKYAKRGKYEFTVGGDGTMMMTDLDGKYAKVRRVDGTTTRYPKEGSFEQKPAGMSWLDLNGHAYLRTRDQKLLVLKDEQVITLKDLANYIPTVLWVHVKGKGAILPTF